MISALRRKDCLHKRVLKRLFYVVSKFMHGSGVEDRSNNEKFFYWQFLLYYQNQQTISYSWPKAQLKIESLLSVQQISLPKYWKIYEFEEAMEETNWINMLCDLNDYDSF